MHATQTLWQRQYVNGEWVRTERVHFQPVWTDWQYQAEPVHYAHSAPWAAQTTFATGQHEYGWY